MTSRKFFGELGKRTPEKRRVSSGIVYQKLRLTEFANKFQKHQYSAAMFYDN
jgi:hypothetical protein